MRNIWTIAIKELRTYFTSPIAYAALFVFLAIVGLVFNLQKTMTPMGAQANMQGLTGSMIFVLILLSPAITMRLLAEERSSGTLEVLLTSPVREYQVVLGKYLAAVILYGIMMVITFEFPIFLRIYGRPDFPPMLVNYVGWLLCAASFLAVGVMTSSVTRSQIAAFCMGLGILLMFWLIGIFAGTTPGSWWADVFRQMSILDHLQEFERGTLALKSVAFFVSMIVFFLFASVRAVESLRWR
ncbi:MAG: ABC transporter permease [Armatimonadota bacterium]|jgi:ABC-2 type transport system permease protein